MRFASGPASLGVLMLMGFLQAGGGAQAGSLKLMKHLSTSVEITGKTLEVNWADTGFQGVVAMEQKVTVVNTGAKEISVGVRKVELCPLQKDVSHVFCFAGLCYSEDVYVSPFSETIPAGKSDSGLLTDFKGQFLFDNTVHQRGVFKAAYVFYDEKNPADSAVLYVNYNTIPATGIAPNPGRSRPRQGRRLAWRGTGTPTLDMRDGLGRRSP